MKNTIRFSLFVLALSIAACKKTNKEVKPEPVPEKIVQYKDSISFNVDDNIYVFEQRNQYKLGNRRVNIKRYEKEIPGGKLAYQTGNSFWYGAQDSTLFSVGYGYNAKYNSPAPNILEFEFIKKYLDKQLKKGDAGVAVPSDLLEIFKVGKVPFAVDLEKENTFEGISMVLYARDVRKTLISAIPGFSILIRSDLKTDIQDNSNFEITKFDLVEDQLYQIEAKFELNLFDDDAKLYRLRNGYLRMRVRSVPGFTIN